MALPVSASAMNSTTSIFVMAMLLNYLVHGINIIQDTTPPLMPPPPDAITAVFSDVFGIGDTGTLRALHGTSHTVAGVVGLMQLVNYLQRYLRLTPGPIPAISSSSAA